MAVVLKLFFVCDDGARYPVAMAGSKYYAITGPHWINEVYGTKPRAKFRPHICLGAEIIRGSIRVQAEGRKT